MIRNSFTADDEITEVSSIRFGPGYLARNKTDDSPLNPRL